LFASRIPAFQLLCSNNGARICGFVCLTHRRDFAYIPPVFERLAAQAQPIHVDVENRAFVFITE
jgi:hypothetical protein